MDIDRVTQKRDSYGPDAQPSHLPKWLQRISGVAAVIGCTTCISGPLSIGVRPYIQLVALYY